MRKLLALFLVLLSIKSYAIDYYISNAGNDANNGTSTATPWATINKLNASWGSINSGDRIFFQSGGIFFGTINVAKSGITLGSYGTGAKPIITGFHTIPSWTAAGTNLWTATIPSTLNNVRLLTINDRVIRCGRFPDYVDDFPAWLRYSNQLGAVSPVTVTSTTAIATNLADGELVLFKNNWNLDVMPIQSISGNNITCLNPAGLYGIAANPYIGNWGFFVQNSINALNVQNEWHYSNASKVVTMFSASNPSTLGTIKIPTLTTIIVLGGQTNITINGLDVQGCSEKAITGSGSNVTITNCIVRFAQGWGIDLRGPNSLVQNNLVRDIGSNGLWVTSSANITGNTFETCGNIEGLAGLTNSGAGTQGNQDNQHQGIEIETGNTSVVNCSNNIIDSSGYAGVRYYGSNITIERNFITYPCISKSDGGGIYSWDQDGGVTFTNRRVKNNVIINSGKFLFGTSTPGLNTQGYGIYCDAGTSNVLIDSNVIGPALFSPNAGIQGCNTGSITNTEDDGAIYLNGARNVTVRGNIVFGWPQAIAFWRYGNVPALANVTGMRIVGNALYTNPVGNNLCTYNTSFRYYTYDASTIPQIIAQIQGFGVMDSNFIANSPSPFMYKGDASNPGGPVTFATWRTNTGKDLNSVNFPTTTPEFQYNETAFPKTYAFSGRQKRDFRGNIYNNQATIPPFYGNIFFDNGPAQGTTLAAFSSATQINCAGGTSTVTVSATGGVPPYTGTGTFTGVLAGTYTYTVTDAAANTITTTVNIPQPAALTANSTKTNILCSGGSTGTITVAPIGGTPNYTFNWGGGVTTQNRTGLPVGTYTCTITDSRGCTTTTSQTINQPAPLSAGSPTAPPILVNGGSTTITQPLPTGGTIPYLYQLNTGTFQSSNIFNSVSAGNYTITIRDANNCTTASTISITQPTVFSATATAGTIACNGGSANVTVSASGGTPPYTGTGTFSRTAGTYVFTVTDAGGSTASANVTITQPTALAATISSTNVVCNGASTGTITLAPTGGTGAYTYLWNGGQTTQNRSALAAGTYSVVITDANGCTLTRSATINQPAALVVTATPTPATIICNGGTSSVVVGASGGTAPYTGIGTFQQSAGTTTYTINDANSCPASTVVTLTQPAVLTAPNPTSGTITANGGTTSITQGAPTGGVSPYSYSLNTGAFQSSNVFTNVAAGTYTVNIRDANGCTITRSITVTQPAVFSASAVRTGPLINCNGQNTVVTVSASGGTAPYTGTGTFTVPAGSYNYTITDALGNTASASIVITQPTQVVPSIAAGSITSIGGTTNVVVSATGGTSPYTGVGTFTRNAGLYAFTVTDSNGCSTIATISLNDPTLVPNQILILNSSFRNGN